MFKISKLKEACIDHVAEVVSLTNDVGGIVSWYPHTGNVRPFLSKMDISVIDLICNQMPVLKMYFTLTAVRIRSLNSVVILQV